jgi:hypothetical protein
MLGTTGAADPVHIVLADLDADLWQIVHLVRAFDAHISGLGQIRPAPAATFRAVRHPLIGGAPHGIALPFAPCCFPRLRPELFARFGVGFVLPGRPSLEGGIEELPLLRETNRSSRRTRSSSATLISRN